MPGVLATSGLVKVDDPACRRVYAGRPIAVGDATLLSSTQLRMRYTGRTPVSRGQGGPRTLSIGNGGGYGRRRGPSELVFGMHLTGTGRWIYRGRPAGSCRVRFGMSVASAIYGVFRRRTLSCFPIRLRRYVVGRARGWGPGGHSGKSGRRIGDGCLRRPHGVRTRRFGMFRIRTYVCGSGSQGH